MQYFSLCDGILYRHNFPPDGNRWLLVVPTHLRPGLLRTFYDDPMRFAETYARIKCHYFWPKL